MTTRELWQNITHYGDFDRMPVIHWTGWPETIERWAQEGMPPGVNQHEYGVGLYGLDSDGQVELLLPSWMDAGINVIFPLEPGTWGATPEKARRKFGRELRIVGGYDKLALEKGPEAIDAELESHLELLKTGGLVLMPDHLITPGTSLENYKYYLEKIRQLRL